jgi:hypothetical protein
VDEGEYAAEVEVELIETDEGWSPYLSLEASAGHDLAVNRASKAIPSLQKAG